MHTSRAPKVEAHLIQTFRDQLAVAFLKFHADGGAAEVAGGDKRCPRSRKGICHNALGPFDQLLEDCDVLGVWMAFTALNWVVIA